MDQQTWDAVQARLAAVREKYTRTRSGKAKGRAVPGNASPQPLSGLLFCGCCGAPMVINGGSARRRYACSHARQRRTCKNRLTVKVSTTEEAILGGLRRRFTNPVALTYIREKIAGRMAGLSGELEADLKERRVRLERTLARSRRLVEQLADGLSSESILSAIRDFDAQAGDERLRIADLEAQLNAPIALPSNAQIRRQYLEVESMVKKNPMRGREALRSLFGGGLRLTPGEDGVYVAQGELSWLGFVLRPRNKKPSAEGSGRGSRLIDSGDCGGRI